MIQHGCLAVADTCDGAAAQLQAIGNDVDAVGIQVVGANDVREEEEIAYPSRIGSVALDTADVQRDARVAGLR